MFKKNNVEELSISASGILINCIIEILKQSEIKLKYFSANNIDFSTIEKNEYMKIFLKAMGNIQFLSIYRTNISGESLRFILNNLNNVKEYRFSNE